MPNLSSRCIRRKVIPNSRKVMGSPSRVTLNLSSRPIPLNRKDMRLLPNRVIRHLSNLLLSPSRSPI